MTDLIQVISIAVSGALLLFILDLVRRRKLTEEYSFIWIIGGGALLVLSIWRGILDAVALWVGIYYPPALLLLMVILFVFVASLYFSVVISRQRQQIERLIEDVAILEAMQRDLMRRLGSSEGHASDQRHAGHTVTDSRTSDSEVVQAGMRTASL